MNLFSFGSIRSARQSLGTCLVLSLLLLGGCSQVGILQDKGGSQQSGLTTPGVGLKKKETAPLVPAPPSAAPAIDVTSQPLAGTMNVAPAGVAPATAGKIKVALLVPLSGKSAPLGQAMVNAAQLAVFDMGSQGFELMPRDTGGAAQGAVQAAQDAVASGAQLVIGPLFAAEVAAAKPVVRGSGLNMLALSTDVSLAESGAYVMGFAPAPQVERVVSFAAGQGLRRFAAVIPSGPYGALVAKAFEASVRQHGGTLVGQEGPSTLQALAVKKDQIDAILLPFGGTELRKIAGQLAAAGFEKDRVRLLGTGLWDEPNLAEGEAMLVGGWYAAAEPVARERFATAYKENYGQHPPRLATLAYDATALAAVLVQNGAAFDSASLTNPSGFAGLDGIFRLSHNGQIDRGLAINELTLAGSKVIDPSPSNFAGR